MVRFREYKAIERQNSSWIAERFVAAFYGTLFIEKEGSPVQEDKLSGTASLFLAKLFCYL
jgi:hypothetical protein